MPRKAGKRNKRPAAGTGAWERGLTLVLDPSAGLSGDMFLGCMIALGADRREIERQVSTLPGLERFRIVSGRVKRRGVTAVRARVTYPKKAHPRDLQSILSMIRRSRLEPDVKESASRTFDLLGRAEAKIHGVPAAKVHFHEVGAIDSIVDIVGSAVALSLIGRPAVFHRPFVLGSGFVTFSHGTLPLPAPATLEVLRGRTVTLGRSDGEVVTPTGAALAAALARELPEDMPLVVDRVVYAVGTREQGGEPGMLRVAACAHPVRDAEGPRPRGLVAVIRTTIDDMTPELFGYVQEKLFEEGALDVFMSPVSMKKNRPGVLLTVLCGPGSVEALADLLLTETTTIGLRIGYEERIELERTAGSVETPFGRIEVKHAVLPGGGVKTAPEYESCRKAARKHGVTVREVFEAAAAASVPGGRRGGSGRGKGGRRR